LLIGSWQLNLKHKKENMELTEKELKELNKIPSELRDKILKMFSNPIFNVWQASRTQLDAVCNEFIANPKLIDEEIDFDKYSKYENADKIIMAISTTARAKNETALKWMKELEDLSKIERSLFASLTPDEQEKANTITTTAAIRKQALGNV
jgi:hypothetical protein